jgi:signal transduction histidine kinase/ActR/RegA family two-component response regulator
MNVRSKLAVGSGLGLLILLGVFYIGGRFVVLQSLSHASRSMTAVLPEVRRALDHERRQLEFLAVAAAGSASLSTEDRHAALLDPGATNEWDATVLGRLGIDLFAVADAAGVVLLAHGQASGDTWMDGSGTLALALAPHLRSDSRLATELRGGARSTSGLLALPAGPTLVAAAPAGAGMVLVGRSIENVNLLRRLTLGLPAQTALVRSEHSSPGAAADGPPGTIIGETILFDAPILWRMHEPLRVRLPLRDLYGHHVVSLTMSLPHSFKGLADLALTWLTLFVACVGAVFIIPLFLFQGRAVLDPLSRLARDVQTLGNGVPHGRRLDWKRRDEFGIVARMIDDMLESIDREHAALTASNENLRALLAATPDLIFVVDRDGMLIEIANQNVGRMGRLFGSINKGQNVRQNREIAESVISKFVQRIGEVLDTGRIQIFEYDCMLQDSTACWMEVRMVRLSDKLVLALIRDMTERRHAQHERARIEEKMAQLQRTESLGVLAGGMAHDFNNLLTAMLGHVEVIMGDSLSPAAQEAIENIRMAMIRASTLTRQMLSYAGQGTFTFEVTDLNGLIQDLMRLMKRSISSQAELVLNFGEGVPLVEADATQIWQVVMNLLINASDAMASIAGTITLTTAHVQSSAEELENYLSSRPLPPGDYAMIEVRDTGHGMDKRTIARIYDPFFTTKSMGRGLGLSACLGIIRAHNGGISVASQSGEGTTFRILLPALRDAAGRLRLPEQPGGAQPGQAAEPAVAEPAVAEPAVTALPSPEPTAAHGTGRILVADNDVAILRLIELVLKGKGFTVAAAESGEAALELFEQGPEAFRLALVDVSLGNGMSGIETCQALHQRHATLPTIIMSGYREQEIHQRVAGKVSYSFLGKPFVSADLLGAVHRALQAANDHGRQEG